MKGCGILFLTLMLCFTLEVQSSVIAGVVKDNKNNAVPFATLMVKRLADSVLVKGEIADEKGAFSINVSDTGLCFLQVQMTGFENYFSTFFDLTTGIEIIPMNIQLVLADKELAAVSIVAEKPFIERKADRTVVNIENSIVQTGSSVMEVIEKLPGVLVDQDGNIRLKGKQGVIILIDGKRSLLSGQDLVNMLKGMSASSVSNVEIITNPPAKYDASGNAGIINIITKRNKSEGYNGSVNISYGQGRYGKSSNTLNLSYKNKNLNLYFSYNYSYRKGFNNLILDRKFYENDTLKTRFLTNNYINFPFQTHLPKLGFDYFFNQKTSVSVVTSLNANNIQRLTSNHTDITGIADEKVGTFDFTQDSKDKIFNGDANIQLTHKFDTLGQEIVTNLDYVNYKNISDQYFTNNYFDSPSSQMFQSYFRGNQYGSLALYSVKTDYIKPIDKTINFEAGFKSSLVTSDKDMRFYNPNTETNVLDTARSSHFLYDENINAAYVSINKQFKKLQLQMGLRAEHTNAHGLQKLNNASFNRNYLQVFPTVYLDYKFNDKHGINMNLGRRIDRPGYEQMNPFKRLIDATTYSEGNPYLLPQLSYNSELSYNYKSTFFVTFNYSLTTNNITDVLIQDSQTKTTIQSIVNIDQLDYFSFDISYSKRLTKWWKTTSNLLSYYGKYKGVVNNYTINQGRPSFFLNSSNSFTIVDGLSAECNLQYTHRNLYGVTWMKSNCNLSVGLQKSLLKKKASLTVNFTDIFWNAYPRGTTIFGNVNEEWASRRDTRVLTVAFNYRFGKANIGKMRRDSGADDEKSRI